MNQQDKDLNDYLEGNSEVSELYQSTMNQEPPASLDQLIMREAKAAVARSQGAESKARNKDGFFSRLFNSSWLVPTASLASFAVIAVVIAVLVSSSESNEDDDNIVHITTPSNGTQPVNSSKRKNVGPEGLQTSTHTTKPPATAELWISKINALHKAGKTEAAKTSYALFQKKYPKYPADKLKQALKDTGLVK